MKISFLFFRPGDGFQSLEHNTRQNLQALPEKFTAVTVYQYTAVFSYHTVYPYDFQETVRYFP